MFINSSILSNKLYLIQKFKQLKHEQFLISNLSNLKLTSWLFGINLNLLTKKNKNFFCFGRSNELNTLFEILNRQYKKNILLCGPSNIGKTSFINYFAFQINNGLVPFVFEKKIIISFNFLYILSNTYLKKNFILLFNKLIQNPNIIFFFDDFQNYIFLDSLNEIINHLKLCLKLNKCQCILTLFTKDKKIFLQDHIFNKTCDILILKEINKIATLKTLYLLRPKFETFYNIKLTPGVLKLAILLSKKYIKIDVNPKKCINLIDEICSMSTIKTITSLQNNIFFKLIFNSLNIIKLLKIEAFRNGNIYFELFLSKLEQIYLSLLNNSLLNNESIILTLFSNINQLLNQYSTKLHINLTSNFILVHNQIINNFENLSLFLYKIWFKNNYNTNIILNNKLILTILNTLKFKKFKPFNNISEQKLKFFHKLINQIKLILLINQINLNLFNTNLINQFINNLNILLMNNTLPQTYINNIFPIKKNIINEDKFISLFSKKINKNLIEKIDPINNQILIHLEDILRQHVIAQPYAIITVSEVIRRAKLGLHVTSRPIASFLFCGPTGVGKTEMSKVLARFLFQSLGRLIRFDMSEFMEKFNVSKLIGSPPGYIGFGTGGQLTEAVRKNPYSVVLFDEIEKAHPEVLNLLLQILDDGRLTDAQKKLVRFKHTIIILTSNVGAKIVQYFSRKLFKIQNRNKTPIKLSYIETNEFLQIHKSFTQIINNLIQKRFFISQKKEKPKKKLTNELIYADLKYYVMTELHKYFLPEFLNRLDEIIIFFPLVRSELRKICNLLVTEIQNKLKKAHIYILVSDLVKETFVGEGTNMIAGARPLRRLISRTIYDLVSQCVLKTSHKQHKFYIKIILQNNKYICQLM